MVYFYTPPPYESNVFLVRRQPSSPQWRGSSNSHDNFMKEGFGLSRSTSSSSSSQNKHTYMKQRRLQPNGQQQQQQQQQQRRRRRKNRRVVFATHLDMIDDHPFEFTNKEKAASFYTRRDRSNFEYDRIMISKAYGEAYKAGQEWDDDLRNDTIRGLEDFFTSVSKEAVRAQHVERILIAQKNLQLDWSLNDNGVATTLRYISSAWSAKARQRAIQRGMADEICVWGQ